MLVKPVQLAGFVLWFAKKELKPCKSWTEVQTENDGFFVALGSAFARLNLLVYELQKKKHSEKTVSYEG